MQRPARSRALAPLFVPWNSKGTVQSPAKRVLLASLFLLVLAPCLMAQQVTVKRHVNLRTRPSTDSAPIELLQKGATLTLLDATPQAGYYHVKTADGRDGWVWSRNISVSPIVSPVPQTPSTDIAMTGADGACDASLWDHVYNPHRLIVKQNCVTVTGTIVDATNGKRSDGVRHEPDGDTHGWLKVDPQFANLLNAGNMSNEGGNLVFEVVCKFHVAQQDAVATCPSTYHSTVQIPPVGSRVRIVGTYVQDMNHAQWMEIHPVTSITVIP